MIIRLNFIILKNSESTNSASKIKKKLKIFNRKQKGYSMC